MTGQNSQIEPARIGVFDSGFGGLDVMRGIVKILPQYDYIYLGDTARVPYGNRSKDTVYEFTRQGADFLFGRGCGVIILACNTASSDALRRLQQEYLPSKYPQRRILGVLIPAVQDAVLATRNKRIGVIATSGTVGSEAFVREVKKLDSRARVFQRACPLLVPLVEAGEHNSPPARAILKNYLAPLLKKNIDTLILGCTHYGILRKEAEKIVGRNIKIISESDSVPPRLKNYLERHPEIEKLLGKKKRRRFYSTDLTDTFQKLGSKFFGRNIKVEKAVLEHVSNPHSGSADSDF